MRPRRHVRGRRDDGDEDFELANADRPEHLDRAHQRLDRHGVGRGGDDHQVAALGQRFQLFAVWPGFGVEDDMLKITAHLEGLIHVHDAKRQPGFTTGCPSRRRPVRVVIDEQGRGQRLQIGRQVNGGRGLTDSAFVAGNSYDHRFCILQPRLAAWLRIRIRT